MRVEINRNIDEVWRILAPVILEACNECGDQISPGELNQEIRSGHMAMLVALDDDNYPWGCSILRFENWASGVKLRTVLMAGERLSDWFELMYDAIAECGRLGGANGLVTQGRKGWQGNALLGSKPGLKILGYIAEVPL